MRTLLRAAALLVVGALLLTACAGLPVTGSVEPGQTIGEVEGPPDFAFVPAGPVPGMTPQQIVEGFIAAGSGPREDWETARMFLTAQARERWNPQAGVTIYSPGDRTIEVIADDEIVFEVHPRATVDATGAYAIGGTGAIRLPFRLQQVEGEWRIAETLDGIVLDSNRFDAVFRSYALMYFDPTWTYLVPDERWFPASSPATRIAEALVDGRPSPWLAESVATAFSEPVRLARRSVPTRSSVAEVTLTAGARDLDQLILDRMQTQLYYSLATAGVIGVDMLVGEQVLTAATVATRSTRTDPRVLVLQSGTFGFLSGAEVEPIPALSRAIVDADPDTVEVDADRTRATLRTADGRVLRVSANGSTAEVDTRAELVPPSIDTAGFVWTVPADDPHAVIVHGPDGIAHPIADAWPGAMLITAMAVSRDGTRVAALVRDGTQPVLQVAGIVRDRDGTPTALGDARAIATLEADGIALTWLGDATLAVVGADGAGRFVLEQPVGGDGTVTRAPEDVISVAAGGQSGGVRLLTADGDLLVRRGATWQTLAADVQVLAVQQGAPR